MSNRSEPTIKGLRTQEGERFHRFFALIQTEAQKQSATFFADAGDGIEFETTSGQTISNGPFGTKRTDASQSVLKIKKSCIDVYCMLKSSLQPLSFSKAHFTSISA